MKMYPGRCAGLYSQCPEVTLYVSNVSEDSENDESNVLTHASF